MKIVSILILCFFTVSTYGQDTTILNNGLINKTTSLEITITDTCLNNANLILENYISLDKNDAPLILYNGIILCNKELSRLNLKLITESNVIRCPESYRYFGAVGINGLVFLRGKQKLKFTTPNEIRTKKINRKVNNLIYALNGYIITDSTILISKKSIIEIEILQSGIEKGINPKYKNFTCLNIWTLTKEERKEIKFKPCGLIRRYAEIKK